MSTCVKIAAVGDICLGDHYFSLGHGTSSFLTSNGPAFFDKKIQDILKSADFAFCNLECPLCDTTDAYSEVEMSVFRGKPQFTKYLRRFGFTTVNIANNHIVQHGREGFRETIDALRVQNMSILGLPDGINYFSLPQITTLNGVTVGFVGYSLVPEQYLPEFSLYASPNLQSIFDDISRLTSKVDVLVVSVHAGEEGIILPHLDIIKNFRKMVDAGVDVVLGHHSHVFQPVEKYKNGIIFYSLGDFIFDLFWDNMLVQSALAWIEISGSGEIRYKIIPTVMTRDYHVLIMPESNSQLFLQRVEEAGKLMKQDLQNYEAVFSKKLKLQNNRLVLKKILYFLLNFHKGNMSLKMQFLLKKIQSRFLQRL